MELLQNSRTNNPAYSITGMLVYNGQYFLHCIEGDDDNVNQLIQNISKDKRHKDVTLLGKANILDRAFESLEMGLIFQTKTILDVCEFITGNRVFNPTGMTFESAKKLLIDLSRFTIK
jgi:hypothetical protein